MPKAVMYTTKAGKRRFQVASAVSEETWESIRKIAYCRVGGWRGGVIRRQVLQPLFPGFPCGPLHADHGQAFLVSSPRCFEPRMRFPSHGSPTPFTAGIRPFPPGFPRPGCDDDSIKADQAEIRGCRGEINRHPKARLLAVLLADEQREPHPRIVPDLAEALGSAPGPEVRTEPRKNAFTSCAIAPGGSGSQRRPASSRIRSRACRMALSEGQRARNVTRLARSAPASAPAGDGSRGNQTPSAFPSSSRTMRVLAAFGSRPRPASRPVRRSSDLSAWLRDQHITIASSA